MTAARDRVFSRSANPKKDRDGEAATARRSSRGGSAMAGPKILPVFLKGNEMLPVPKEGSGLMTVVFDLDNTLAEGTWPSPWIGKPIEKAITALLRYHDQGYEIVLWTSRPASHLDEIKRWLRNNGLADIVYDVRTDKIRAALYVDDRAAVWPESFEAVVTDGDRRRQAMSK